MRVPLQADVGGAQLEDLVEQLGQQQQKKKWIRHEAMILGLVYFARSV